MLRRMITRLHHIATVVPTLEDGAAVWRDRFGLEVECEATVPAQGVRAALLPCGDGEVELLQALDPEGAIAKYLAKGGGLHHVCFESTDVAAELARLEADGVRLIDSVPRPGLAGQIGFVHPKATLGTLIELATPGDGVDTEDFAEPHPPAEPTFRTVGFHSLTFATADADAALAAFRAQYGIGDDAQEVAVDELDAVAVRIPLPNAHIDLATPAADDGWLATRLAERGEGACVLGLVVTTLQPGVDQLRAEGIDCVERTASDGTPVVVVDGDGQFGVTLVLREPA